MKDTEPTILSESELKPKYILVIHNICWNNLTEDAAGKWERATIDSDTDVPVGIYEIFKSTADYYYKYMIHVENPWSSRWHFTESDIENTTIIKILSKIEYKLAKILSI